MSLSIGVDQLAGVGQFYAKKLTSLGIRTVEDLLLYPPFRYDDLSLVSAISQVQAGETVTIQGEMVKMFTQRAKSGKWIQKGIIRDSTGEVMVTWFNQPFLVRALRGKVVALSGKIDKFGGKNYMTSPDYELVNDPIKSSSSFDLRQIHTGRLVPVYPETQGVSSRWLRGKVRGVLLTRLPVEDYLPVEILKEEKLIGLNQAIQQIHFPGSLTQAREARKRLAFNELLLLHLASLTRRKEWQETTPTHVLKIDGERVFAFLNKLQFELTRAQKRVIQEILLDLGKGVPMNRLLTGDVGSGKTVVAALAIYVAFLNKQRSALMAPTQILANQHFNTLKEMLIPLGVKVELVLAGRKLKTGSDVVVGTHALIHKRADLAGLALVVIDEQHKFGVEQRADLVNRKQSPHVLTMTATPIPRTIALTVFGDLDLSVLDEMPPGRRLVKTRVVSKDNKQIAYKWVNEKIVKEKIQAFIVCPLIEDSNAETMQSVKAVKSEFLRLQNEIFSDLRLGLLHGKMKMKEKEKVISEMIAGNIDILVTTPVVEVGMDIPMASIIAIEAAERFGLAQLHQLRGRVGRRGQQGYCLLFAEKINGKSSIRFEAMERTATGSELAELDLSLRGPGEVYGTRQHGYGELAIADFSDRELIEKARKTAEKLLPNLDSWPALVETVKKQMTKISVEPN